MKKIALTLVGFFLMGWAMAQSGNHWTPISGTQYNMTVKGIIVIDGVTQASNQLEIGAFCGDECRGSRKAALFPPTGEYPVMLTVVSNVYSGETITFRIYDHDTQQELNLQSESTLVFEHNTNQGSMGNWFQFVFTTPAPASWDDPDIWGGSVPGPASSVTLPCDVIIGEAGVATVTVANLIIPDGNTLIIEPGSTLIVTGDLTNADEDGLVIEDGAQVINESANVKAVCWKDITSYNAKDNGGWYTISSPVDDMAIAGSDFVTPSYDLYRYNENPESGLEWENYKDNTNVDFITFENGRGYLYANSNTFSPTFVGTLNAAPVVRTLTCSENPDGLSGFNLIGNPFPHAIYKGEGGAIDNANLASGFYTLNDEGAWHVNTYEDAVMPGQGIMVKTTATIDLTIAKSNAEATDESSGAKATYGRIGIAVTGNNGEDRAFVYFGQGIGLNKMANFTDQVPSLWVRDNNTDYAIAHVDNACESLDLFFHNKVNGNFRLTVSTKDVVFGTLQLVDNLTGEVIDLKQQPDYGFHANGNEADGRFKLVFRVTTGVEEMTEDEPFAFINNGQLIVNGEGNLQVVDALGRQCCAKELSTANSQLPTANFPSGIYVLRLINGNETRIQKIVIK